MLIIVAGLPGSGKSFFARKLSRELGAEYINSDVTRKEMSAIGRYSLEDKLSVYEEMAKKAAQSLRKGKTTVVDATFSHHEMRDIFFMLATLLHKRVSYIRIQAQEKIIHERLRKPRPDSEADFAVYQQLKLQNQDPGRAHLVLESTNDNLEMMLARALQYLKQINEGNAG